MEYFQFLLLSIFFPLTIMFLFRKSKPRLNFPPSPANSLPVIGHLHLMRRPFHRKLLSFSQSLGNAPIIYLRLGYRQVYVISSRAIAEECFTKNDIVLANRPLMMVHKYKGNAMSMFMMSYGDDWRHLRRIATSEIFSSLKLSTFSYIRRDENRRLVSSLSRDSLHGFVEVELKTLFMNLACNNVMRVIAGRRYYGDDTDVDEDEAKVSRRLISEAIAGDGGRNPADYLPFLRWFTSHEAWIKDLGRRFNAFLQSLVDEKRSEKDKSETLISHLLSLQETQPDQYTDGIIKGILFDMIAAGTDTVSITLEWALTNLLNHPEMLTKARIEIDDKIGLNRLLDETDIVNLPYLQNIIYETLRLYPPGPVIPHLSSRHCIVGGYDMPRDTMLLVNIWAINRDPEVWEEAELFKPERFDKEGSAQKLMTFGQGRRACPGGGLANRLIGLTLGSLIQCFEWERVDDKPIDIREGRGLTMPKKNPLRAMCKTRPMAGKLIMT